jgi:hypothetical protein
LTPRANYVVVIVPHEQVAVVISKIITKPTKIKAKITCYVVRPIKLLSTGYRVTAGCAGVYDALGRVNACTSKSPHHHIGKVRVSSHQLRGDDGVAGGNVSKVPVIATGILRQACNVPCHGGSESGYALSALIHGHLSNYSRTRRRQ